MRQFKFLLATLFFCLLPLSNAQADPVIVPLPLNSPVSLSLTSNPVVTIGTRTIDFTPNLNQQFISFLPAERIDSGGNYRATIGIRALAGLASLSGNFPASPDPNFANQLPIFSVGTTDLILFDVVVGARGSKFSFILTDMNGQTRTANFSSPVPEPATMLLLSAGLAGIGAATRKRRGANRRS